MCTHGPNERLYLSFRSLSSSPVENAAHAHRQTNRSRKRLPFNIKRFPVDCVALSLKSGLSPAFAFHFVPIVHGSRGRQGLSENTTGRSRRTSTGMGCPGMPSEIRRSPPRRSWRRRAVPAASAALRPSRAFAARHLRPAADAFSLPLSRELGGLDAFGAYALPLVRGNRGPAP